MLFNSLTFLLIILPTSVIACYLCNLVFHKTKYNLKIQNLILVLYSILFYAWSGLEHLKILVLLIIVNFILGILINKIKFFVIPGVLFNVGILVYFKYLPFIGDILNKIVRMQKFNFVTVIAPLGISFIIFHCISYVMDVYRKKAKPAYNIVNFALYISFFAKISQGPIVKYYEMIDDIDNRVLGFDQLVIGIERFIIGISKKVLIADVLAIGVADIFGKISIGLDVPTAWLGSLLFTMQLYFDFSGYSDMAIGIGKMLGFKFKENFDFPYLSTSITEFWRRWHISLGSWFKEYLYIPLGGNRRGNVYINLFIVFLVTGIWHGAAGLYLVWGMIHGICMLIERVLMKKSIFNKIPTILRWLYTMFVVNIGWIMFRVTSFEEFFQYLKCMFGLDSNSLEFTYQYFLTNRVIVILLIAIIGIIIFSRSKIKEKFEIVNASSIMFACIKYITLISLVVLCYIFIVSSSYSPFLYFQF